MQDNLAVAFRPRLGRPTAVSFDGVTTYHMELDRLDADRHPTFS